MTVATHVTSTSAEPGLSVAAAARRLGVAPATLRTWDRRYGIGPSQRTSGAHRRYTAEDLRLLEAMMRHIAAGLQSADAARAARTSVERAATTAAGTGAGTAAGAQSGTDAAGTVTVIGPAAAQRGLLRSARSLDASAATEVVHRCLAARGVVWTWDNVLLPVLQVTGEYYARTGGGIEVEHLLSGVVHRELVALSEPNGTQVNQRPVLIAAAEDEEHTLPLFALAAALAERQVQSRTLGARVPVSALAAAIKTIGPSVVFVWSQTTRDLADLDSIAATRPTPLIMAGGPGWCGTAKSAVSRPADLTGAVCAITTAIQA